MLSLRYLTAVSLALVAVNALPTVNKPIIEDVAEITEDSPLFEFPSFADFFGPIWKLLPSFSSFSPSVSSNEKQFKIVISAKEYKKEDLKVKVQGRLLIIQGTHESKSDDHDLVATQFFNTYTLPVNASSADVKAELTSDGYLVVVAPNNGPGDKSNKEDLEITVVESGKPLEKDVTTEMPSYVTIPEKQDDRKEETTPASEKDSTFQDNIIPHGNEVVSP